MSERVNDVTPVPSTGPIIRAKEPSAYTPSTEEVRASWVKGGAFWDARGHEFDRWLAKHDREIKARAWEEGWDVGWGNAREGFNQDYAGPSNYKEAVEYEAYRKRHPRKRLDSIDIDNPYESEEE